jgi:hypothetical protein
MALPLIFAVQGLSQLGLGAYNAFQANKMKREAQGGYDKALQQYRTQDTSNLYSNLENPYEDLTVNQQQAQFQTEQQQQGLADIMGSMRGAAGASGIAAFSQSLANQQSRNIQAASASIGQQEARNQGMAAQGAMNLQAMERSGATQSRALKSDIIGTELGMSMNQLAAANQAKQQAAGQIAGGAGNLLAGGVGMYQDYKGAGGGSDMGGTLPTSPATNATGNAYLGFSMNPSRSAGLTSVGQPTPEEIQEALKLLQSAGYGG